MTGKLNVPRLERWLADRFNSASLTLSSLRPAGTGFSATTFFALLASDSSTREIVIRMEQPGQQVFLDSDIKTQVAVMDALVSNALPAPRVLAFEDDPAILGGRTIVMGRVGGRDFPQSPGYATAGWVKNLSAADRTILWRNALTTLGTINRLTPEAGFSFLDKPQYGPTGLDQYLGWLTAWRQETIGNNIHSLIDRGLDHLVRHQPAHAPPSFVWGDSNPCNMLFDDDLSVSAILDFEAAAIGPGEIDLGWWLFMDRSRVGDKPLPGVPSRSTSIAIYQAALGRSVQDIDYYEILAGVRMAIVIVRTADRLIEAGFLQDAGDAKTHNPAAALLATLLGRSGHEPGQGYRAYARAAGAHHQSHATEAVADGG